MTRRERAIAALAHREPDSVPVDVGGTHDTTCLLGSYRKLRQYLGSHGEPTLANRWLGSVYLDEETMEKLNVDFRPVALPLPDLPEVTEEDGTVSFVDEWGITWKKPPGGLYFDVVEYRQIESVKDVETKIQWPVFDPKDPSWLKTLGELRRTASSLRSSTDYALVLDFGVAPFTMVQLFMGFEQSSISLMTDPALVEAVMDKVLETYFQSAQGVFEAVGDLVDAVYAFADDLGTQSSLWISPKVYRSVIKPFHRRVVEFIKARSRAKIIFHSCGSIVPFIPDLLDVGIDVLSPVQVSAHGMDTKRLKKDFGDALSFWGAIDTQRVLPFGSESDVVDEVRRRIDDLAPGGGFVLSSVHNIQPDVPPQNVVRMVRAARTFGTKG